MKWRARFLRARLAGLPDEPRLEGAAYWPMQELAARVGISPASVHRIWRAFGLQPLADRGLQALPGPLLIDKIREVVGLYLAPAPRTRPSSASMRNRRSRTAAAAPDQALLITD